MKDCQDGLKVLGVPTLPTTLNPSKNLFFVSSPAQRMKFQAVSPWILLKWLRGFCFNAVLEATLAPDCTLLGGRDEAEKKKQKFDPSGEVSQPAILSLFCLDLQAILFYFC